MQYRESNISEHICVATNGTLLHMIGDETLSHIDEVQISLHSLQETLTNKIRNIAEGEGAIIGVYIISGTNLTIFQQMMKSLSRLYTIHVK